MKRFFVFFLFFLLFPLTHINAQANLLSTEVPGLDCGVAGSVSAAKCCYQPPQNLPGINILSLGSSLPFVGDAIKRYQDANTQISNLQLKYSKACINGEPDGDPAISCTCKVVDLSKQIKPIEELCQKFLLSSKEFASCKICAKKGSFWSGFGCVPLQFESFVTNFLLSAGLGFGGLVALGCIVYSAIGIQLSQGNPEKIKKAQENITSCVIGLILVIFSVFILRVIGVDLLQIPFIK